MSNERILVVDDEEDILELVRYNLAKEGYRVTSALTGEDALKKALSETFDLIVLDLMLPGIDGLEVTKRLKNSPNRRRQNPGCAEVRYPNMPLKSPRDENRYPPHLASRN